MSRLCLTSAAFDHGAQIPRCYTRLGRDESPPLAWSGLPDGATSLALVVEDPDAPLGTFVHWVIFDLPVTANGLPAGVARVQNLPGGAKQARNDYGHLGYGGPCPPPGPAHRYQFHLFALAGRLGLSPLAPAGEIRAAIRTRGLAATMLEGRFAVG